MNQKPFIRSGRYYNDEHDSILFRLKNVGRMIWRAIKLEFKGKRSKQILAQKNFFIKEWTVQQPLLAKSQEPVITWLGHATFLVQVGGFNILTDPVFFDISVFAKRLIPAPIHPDQLPAIDAIIISHNHKDHVDEKTLALLLKHQPLMGVPMGTAKWFLAKGFTRVEELMWWNAVTLEKLNQTLTLTFLPASHWTGRSLLDINKSLWGSWMIACNNFNGYFAGDTAYAGHFKKIGQAFPSIDVALMPIGPNEPRDLMYDSHVNAEEALQGFLDLNARHFIPMHWGTFIFGLDSFILPIERIMKAWGIGKMNKTAAKLHIVKMGQILQIPTADSSSVDMYPPHPKQV